MKNIWNTSKSKYAILLSIFLMVSACQQYSEKETDKSAGLNGGFEISQNDLPVNWLMYSPNTVPNADFEIGLDKTIFKEGMQSLRFDVINCSSTGGWHSPGFTNEFTESGQFKGEGTYKLSFWVKNDGSKYRVSAGGVSPMEGDMKKLIESDQQIEDWKYLEYEISVPKEWHLRIELNILQPGTFWIDDIQITKV